MDFEEVIKEKEIDEFLNKAFNKGSMMIEEMGKNFKPYLKIMLNDGVTSKKEQIIIFGIYLLQSKKDKEGYGIISKNKFYEFYKDFKEQMRE
jgi:hypothetical protein